VIEGEHYIIGDDSYKKNSDFHLYIKDTFIMILHLCFERGRSEKTIYASVRDDFVYRIDIVVLEQHVLIVLSGNLNPNKLEKLIELNWDVVKTESNPGALKQELSQKNFLGDFITGPLFATLEHLEIHHLEM
tara:strand:- start:113 stop:508 length:396 start_codon:yes stop_codon:yes gene_type:complete